MRTPFALGLTSLALMIGATGCEDAAPSGGGDESVEADDADLTGVSWPRACEGEPLTKDELLPALDDDPVAIGTYTILGRSRRCDGTKCSRWSVRRAALVDHQPVYGNRVTRTGTKIFLEKSLGGAGKLTFETLDDGPFWCRPAESDGLPASCSFVPRSWSGEKVRFQLVSTKLVPSDVDPHYRFVFVTEPSSAPADMPTYSADIRITKSCVQLRASSRDGATETEYVLSGAFELPWP